MTHLLKRGQFETPGAVVQAGFLSVLVRFLGRGRRLRNGERQAPTAVDDWRSHSG